MNKAIAAHAIFIVSVILIFLFFIAAIFFKWIDWSKLGANKFFCSAKLHSYCSDWKKTNFEKTPWNWNEKGPEGCEEFGIMQPSQEDCEKLLG